MGCKPVPGTLDTANCLPSAPSQSGIPYTDFYYTGTTPTKQEINYYRGALLRKKITPIISIKVLSIVARYRRQAFNLTRGLLFTDLDLYLTLILYFKYTRLYKQRVSQTDLLVFNLSGYNQ